MAQFLYIGNRPASSSKARLSGDTTPYSLAVFRFDEEELRTEPVSETGFERDFAAGKVLVDEEMQRLYITNDASFHGEHLPGGSVYAYRIDPESGRLHFLNGQPSLASKSNYAALDDERRYLLLTNHGDRSSINSSSPWMVRYPYLQSLSSATP